MKVLVDTCIWSHALRSKKPEFESQVKSLETLIADQRVLIIGAIRQEILSGYSDLNKFELLKTKLSYFENTPILDEDYIIAAKFYNECRQKGVQGSHIDLLICAVAVRLNIPIFTSDKDFGFYQQHLPIKLYPATT
ncbi:type II toxin-antitoxin system VapC family toxin [Methylobacter tundripaludum]|uniref:PilT protein domain protein n=1 Tax=Methylobacter tundripaludum (strain ATCC BAA-1195 / DSM 17260 / SV96) TaxID=697282 RepID=G3IRY2_METTV|nr:PIN domain-containing protein [Methylobacter tundripaludum]EGW22193.1 PilT protein domain protein [Methylobacter tundripaludum SV96]